MLTDTPILDDRAVCPTCLEPTWPDRLCEHDDHDTGPLCLDRCCGFWHETRSAA